MRQSNNYHAGAQSMTNESDETARQHYDYGSNQEKKLAGPPTISGPPAGIGTPAERV